MLTIHIRILFVAKLGNHNQEVAQLHFERVLTVTWEMGGWGSDLDYSVIMQPNLDWGIIINCKKILCIALAEATICLCFAEGALLDRRTTLANLVRGMKSGWSAIRTRDISSGKSELVKNRVDVMRSFGGSWKFAFSRAKISERLRLVLILTGQIGGIGGFSWPPDNGMTHFRQGPFTQRSMSFGQKTKSVRFINCTL